MLEITYTKIKVPEGHIKLSPSGLSEFRRNKKGWYDKAILNISDFRGNKASVQGGVLHFIAECHFHKVSDEDYWKASNKCLKDEVENYIITEAEAEEIKEYVSKFKPVIEDWLDNKDPYDVVESEGQVNYQIRRTRGQTTDFHIAGSFDAIVAEKNIVNGEEVCTYGIRDYKSSKRKISSLASYRQQLLAYTLAINKTHPTIKISFIEVVALVWNKTNGFTITSIREEINDETAYLKLTKLVRGIINTYEASLKHPELSDLLFCSGVDFLGKEID